MSTLVLASKAQKFIEEIENLPTLSTSMGELLELTGNVNCSFDEVVNCVGRDPVISARVLQTVNSAYYSQSQRVDNILQAVSRLGMEELRQLSLAISVIQNFKGLPESFDLNGFWTHSFASGMAGMVVARQAPSMAEGQDEVPGLLFVCGLMHHLGQLVEVLVSPSDYERAMEIVEKDELPLFQAELEVFGFHHAHLAAALLGKWSLPDSIAVPIFFHHDPEKCPEPYRLSARALHVSALLCGQLDGTSNFEGYVEEYAEDAWFGLGFDMEDVDPITGKLKVEISKAHDLVAVLMGQ